MTNLEILAKMLEIKSLVEKDSWLNSKLYPQIKERQENLIIEFARQNNMCHGCQNLHDLTGDGCQICNACSSATLEDFNYRLD